MAPCPASNPSISSAADWPAPRPPGNWPAAMYPWCCTRCDPSGGTEAHKTGQLAELVCSNSFRSDDMDTNAVGLLHQELRLADSLIMRAADAHQVPAGGALAVDRDGFSAAVTNALEAHPLVEIDRREVAGLPPTSWDSVIIATGPLTSPALAAAVRGLTGEAELAFFDAIAPIVYKDSIDFDIAWFQSRYDKAGPGGDRRGLHQLSAGRTQRMSGLYQRPASKAEKTEFKEWEKGRHAVFRRLPAD